MLLTVSLPVKKKGPVRWGAWPFTTARPTRTCFQRTATARSTLPAYGLTPTLTWYGKNGLYIDTQAPATWFENDLNSRLAGKLKGGSQANSYGLGIEAGKAFGLSERLVLIPQAQLTYASTRFDSFNDKFGAHVESDKGTTCWPASESRSTTTAIGKQVA